MANFPILSFDQANPVLTAFNRMYANDLAQQQAREAQTRNQYLPDALRIANALKQNELNFAPQMSQATLAEKQQMAPYYHALTGEAGARTDSERIASQLKQLQLNMIKNGQLPISGPGGLGSRFIGGKTYIDPQTGEVKSIPSTASTNYLQRATAASQQLQNLLPEIIAGQSPYLGAGGRFMQGLDTARGFLGYPSDESQSRQTAYNAAEGDLNTATEQMIKAFGLNATNENFKNMRKVIEPRAGETAKGYQDRIQNEIQKLLTRQQQYQNILQGGYTTGQNQNPASPMRLPQSLPLTGRQQQSLQNKFAGQQMTIGPTFQETITPDNIAFTAKKYGISEDEVKRRLGVK